MEGICSAPSSKRRAGSRFILSIALPLFAAALLGCAGCQLTAPPQRSAAPLGAPRSGEVFLIRGLFGIFSTGMDDLQDQLSRQGVRCVALQHTEATSAAQWIIDNHTPTSGPIILVGHSLGADETITLARKLERANIPVDLLITLDPVNAGPVPANVRQAINFYRPGAFDVLPVLRGIPLKSDSPPAHPAPSTQSTLRNVDLNTHPEFLEPGTNHFGIDNNNRIQHTIVNQILSLCPPERDNPGGRAIRAAVTQSPERP